MATFNPAPPPTPTPMPTLVDPSANHPPTFVPAPPPTPTPTPKLVDPSANHPQSFVPAPPPTPTPTTTLADPSTIQTSPTTNSQTPQKDPPIDPQGDVFNGETTTSINQVPTTVAIYNLPDGGWIEYPLVSIGNPDFQHPNARFDPDVTPTTETPTTNASGPGTFFGQVGNDEVVYKAPDGALVGYNVLPDGGVDFTNPISSVGSVSPAPNSTSQTPPTNQPQDTPSDPISLLQQPLSPPANYQPPPPVPSTAPPDATLPPPSVQQPQDPTNIVLDQIVSQSGVLSDGAKQYAMQFIDSAYNTPGDETVLDRLRGAITNGQYDILGGNVPQGDAQSAVNYLYGLTTAANDPSNWWGNTYLTSTVGTVGKALPFETQDMIKYGNQYNNPVVLDAANPNTHSSPMAADAGIVDGFGLGSAYFNTTTQSNTPTP